jgi:PAS domain S-box-containing protein
VGWVDTAVTALRDSNGQLRATVGIIADITERKNAEQVLRENEQKMRTLINAVPDSICFKDGEGRWQEANESSLKLFELEDVRYRGKKDSELAEFSDFYRDAFLTCEETDEKAWAAGPVSRGDEVIPLPDGSSKVLDVIKVPLFHPDGSRKGLVVVGRDITEGKRAEEALQKQYELQRALLSSIPAYVYFKDKDSVYITGNKPFSELSGTPENEIPGKTDYDFFSEMDADSFRRDDAEIIATGKAKLNYEMKGTDAEGNIIWYSTSKSPFYSTSGEVAGLVGICVDITDLKRTQELLLQSERFRAVADLAGGIAHNFNNLLQIVIGYLELALLDLESGNYPDVKDALEKVLESSRFGAETVRRLQSFAGIRDHSQLSEKGVFDLSGVVRQALEMSKTWWKTIPEKEGRKISMVTELQEGCLVQGEKNELFEAVVNLIKNASEALPQGGAIHVKTGLEGSQVVLKVRDTGIGISEKDLGRLFNPFFTTKASAGSGLGLASSRKIIEACGGSILVESSERKGTTFTIRLPLVEQPSEQASPPAQQVSGPGRTVLVIDDMQAVLDLLKAGLTRSGHVVVTASSGQQGLDIFKENPIDLVICDLGMPGINGWEVGKIIRSLCEERGIPKPPFILLTGWGGQKTEAEKISESGVDAVVEKPINIGSLREVVRQLGEREP